MNLQRSNRFAKPLMTIIALAVIFMLMAYTIQILSGAFHYFESLFESSTRQAGQLVTVISINR